MSEWKPIENAPVEDCFSCIVFAEGFVGEASFHNIDGEREWWWANTHGEYHADVISPPPSHWMPLPKPPIT